MADSNDADDEPSPARTLAKLGVAMFPLAAVLIVGGVALLLAVLWAVRWAFDTIFHISP